MRRVTVTEATNILTKEAIKIAHKYTFSAEQRGVL